jgi:hypothetical protein
MIYCTFCYKMVGVRALIYNNTAYERHIPPSGGPPKSKLTAHLLKAFPKT